MLFPLLASLGLTFILKQGRIFNKVRSFLITLHPLIAYLFNCAQCLGFWAGFIISIIMQYSLINIMILSLSTSFIGLITQTLICLCEKIYDKNTL